MLAGEGMLLKRRTGSGERGTEVWERVVSGNLHKNPKWRSKKRERERRSALYSTHQNHIDREGLRLNFGHLVTCYTKERCLRSFDVFASRGFAFLLL